MRTSQLRPDATVDNGYPQQKGKPALNARRVANTCGAALSLPPRLANACSNATERGAGK